MTLLFVLLIIAFSAGYVCGHIAAQKTSVVRTISLWLVGLGFAWMMITIFEKVLEAANGSL